MGEKIDAEFWLETARERISLSIKSREQAADKLDTFLQWVWSIYLGVFALASFFDVIGSNIWQLVWVSQPILILMIARYCCQNVSMPSMDKEGKFNVSPNDVPSIMNTFNLIVADKKCKLRLARSFTLVSILSLMASLIGYNYCNVETSLKQQVKITLLEKELYNNRSVIPQKQSIINDSIKLVNLHLDFQIQNITKKKMLKCLQEGNGKCVDSILKINQ